MPRSWPSSSRTHGCRTRRSPPPANSKAGGQWDLAIDLLAAEFPDPTVAALRADILVDRHWWCLDRAAEAQQAVIQLAADALPTGLERDVLRDTATHLASDLGLSWLLATLRGGPS